VTGRRFVCWLADRLDGFAVVIWRVAHRLRPVYDGPLCPDCRIAPDPGEGNECDVCREAAERDIRERAVELGGYEDGWRDAQRMADRD